MASSGSSQSLNGFRQTETCSDCIERDDVDLLGRVRISRVLRVEDCAGCNGTGRQRREKPDVISWWVSNRDRVS